MSALYTLRQGQAMRLSAPGYSLRSRVNGYGGGALCLLDTWVYGVNGDSGQVDRIDPGSGVAISLTATPGFRYGGLVADPGNQRLLAVRERVDATEDNVTGIQSLVAINPKGVVTVLHCGEDFYSAPTVSDNGRRLAWVSWHWPDMPWQLSTLWGADIGVRGETLNARPLPSPCSGSIQQPRFAGYQLFTLSDHLGWWQPYLVDWPPMSGRWSSVPAEAADHANAPWQLGESHYLVLPGGGWVRVIYRQGCGELWWWPVDGRAPMRLAGDRVDFRSLRYFDGILYCLASRWDTLSEVLAIELATGNSQVLAGGEQLLPRDSLSRPEPFELAPVPGASPTPASGFYYPPVRNKDCRPPPLIVLVHGGPTSATYPAFRPDIQFWCQHGFAVADVNYRGSSGFGRAFRLSLSRRWGQVDVEDACAVVQRLGATGRADPARAFIQGRSSGGYTALMAMARSKVFRGAASLFGVTDPWHLRQCTHRFESGYLDWLLGPADCGDDWREQTPARLAEDMAGPVIFFQGGQDTVVVPQQTATMAAAMTAVGLAPEVHLFPEEGHGFRRRENQADVLSRTLAFYQRLCHPVGEGLENLR